MAIVIIRQDGKIDLWKGALKDRNPEVAVYSYLEEHPKETITMAVIWKHPQGSLSHYPNLKCIASAGAGVDYIFEDTTVPKDVPITRIVDPYLASDMSEHVLAVILAELKNFNIYKLQQVDSHWSPIEYRRIKDVKVGIMGLGELGSLSATDLMKFGFSVQGWSRSKKTIKGVRTFSGSEEFNSFLESTQILVCLLPLTPETEGILNSELFSKLPKGCYIINVARGGHLVNEDLLKALDNGHLSGACLDVYHQEPLPSDHPFWNHPKIFMTPHYASVSDTNSVVPQILENYERLRHGENLLNKVNRNKGY
ncbi:glyoxylate/hydroxypyruvate reductase A [Maribacter sp. PR1]|uniref:Glyoxylate/hydroxypyruvate reductase A n=1 Tax=Maribacter cobaltidurans TaxID=1178778 RepID=A0ABU7ITG5_9FLAO|nr:MULTISPECIES: glyoxylate/hydroxypyruvate reductase A [Maribacter]MDC6388529.1 glyoxylate/hydroxypyruvate reductase A [Maribacter sp. PR1]MEE1975918.1 glyoxylate/hydroxypyruvate reductase A [Maribacter cobaltidurans]